MTAFWIVLGLLLCVGLPLSSYVVDKRREFIDQQLQIYQRARRAEREIHDLTREAWMEMTERLMRDND